MSNKYAIRLDIRPCRTVDLPHWLRNYGQYSERYGLTEIKKRGPKPALLNLIGRAPGCPGLQLTDSQREAWRMVCHPARWFLTNRRLHFSFRHTKSLPVILLETILK
jgi:hypothetical protein